MEISIRIDRFTPCLIERTTEKIVSTRYEEAKNKELYELKGQGWNFDWTADELTETTVYKLMLQNDDAIQGLVAITDYTRDRALYVNIAESAPHNLGKEKQFKGVGGHLFAIAANESVKKGYGGFLFLDAKNIELVEHYQNAFGAIWIGGPHQYRMIIDELSAQRLLQEYTLGGV